jgi:monoamine oxidase
MTHTMPHTMPHTVIVGGGIAGLWLADKISASVKAGDRVTVLEKYGYLGGRIVTSKSGYEIGAGRVHESHTMIRALIRRFGLHTSPIGTDSYWLPLAAASEGQPPELNTFEDQWAAITAEIVRLSPRTLATSTLRDLTARILGPKAATELLNRFPYRAETEKQRADVGLRTFATEMGTRQGYFVVREGLVSIVRGLQDACCRRGVTFHLQTEVTDIQRPAGSDQFVIRTKSKENLTVIADRVVLALHVSALKKIPIVRNHPTIQHVGMAPLTRIYAQYSGGLEWIQKRIVTDSPIRYIIPINPATGLVMISYTDDRDTRFWAGLKGPALQRRMRTELRRLFPDQNIPEAKWMRPYEWHDGCSYWRPGTYDVESASRAIMEPQPGLFVTGESFSPYKQAWMEGALEHAEAVLRRIQQNT